MKYVKQFTVKAWKKFNKPVQADNTMTFINYHKAREDWESKNPEDSFNIHIELGGEIEWENFRESYDYWTLQEILLSKYKIILTDHVNKRGVGLLCPTPFNEKLKGGLKNLPSKMTMKNFDKGMKTFDKGMVDFSKAMDSFSNGLGGSTVKTTKRDQSNINKLVGKGGNSTKIWGTKKSSKRKRKFKNKNWDDKESDMDKIWGRKK